MKLRDIERQYFESLDWTRRSSELADETGCTYAVINRWRLILGKPKVTKWFPACQSWDWAKSNTELGREHGLLPTSVSQLRLELGHDPVPRNAFRPTFNVNFATRRQNWEAVDWTKNDIRIAEELGCTRESVRLWRAKLGKPKSPHKWRFRKFVEFYERFKGRSDLTYEEVSAVLRMNRETFRQYCAQLSITIPPSPSKAVYPWEQFNWQLPNKVLAEIWRGKAHSVAVHRMLHVRPSPLFRAVNGRVPENFLQMVEAEKRKAEDYFNTSQQNGHEHQKAS